MSGPGRKIYRVAELTRLLKAAIEQTFGEVWIEGEISNLRRPASGHLYFTLKDETAQIAVVMFRGDQAALRFRPADGLKVQACGRLTVYERQGNYQMVARTMEPAGQGALQAAFEALKKKLQAEGLFDAARKKPLPLLPRHIGVVTSPTGAAIRDILKVLGNRYPNLHVVLAPVRVQGEGAAQDIAAAIALLNARGGLDVLIVGRGGGSLEDLWCFNEEIVARAIAASCIPVISAVGHEVDFTIGDFVADFRAATPSAAAERVVPRKDHLEEALVTVGRRIAQPLRESLLRVRNRVLRAARSPVFAEPRYVVQQRRRQLAEGKLRMTHALRQRAQETGQRLDDAGLRLGHATRQSAVAARQNLVRIEAQLRALSPLAVLQRGYSLTQDRDGNVLRSVETLKAGQRVRTRLARGAFESDVAAVMAPDGSDRNPSEGDSSP